jgi:hypothetical protein
MAKRICKARSSRDRDHHDSGMIQFKWFDKKSLVVTKFKSPSRSHEVVGRQKIPLERRVLA